MNNFGSGGSPFGGSGGGLGGALGGYDDYMNRALQEYQQHEKQGRGDISQYYQQALGFGQPYRQAGQEGLAAYMGSLGLKGGAGQQNAVDSFRASPGYQYALKQGLQGVQRGEAAHGLSGSGAEMAALQQRSQGMADQQYGQYQQRLAGLAGMGQQSAGQAAGESMQAGSGLAQLGLGYAGGEGNIYSQMAQAQAEEEMAQQQEDEQKQSSEWGGLGSIIGGAMAFL